MPCHFKTDSDAVVSGHCFNAEIYDIAVNPGGKLRVVGTLTDGNFAGTTSGTRCGAQVEIWS